MDQLADGSYRGVFPISDSLFHNLLSCGYHNGDWTLSTDGQPVQYTWYDGARSASPAAVTVVHKNLTIASATASGGAGTSGDYWLFDPENPNLPLVVTYETDKLVNEAAAATLKIYNADRGGDTPLREITASATTDAAGQQITWDGRVNGQLVEKSIYVFDLHVASTAANITDSDDHKSPTLRITSTNSTWTAFDEESGNVTVRMDYNLTEAGTGASVRAYDPDLQDRGETAGPANAGDNSAYDTVLWNKAGPFRFLISAIEESARDHRHAHRGAPRGALQRNSAKDVSITVTFSPSDFLPMPSWANGSDGEASVEVSASIVGGSAEDRQVLEGQGLAFELTSSAFEGYCTASQWPFPQGVPADLDYSFATDETVTEKDVPVQNAHAAATLYPLDCGGVVGVTAKLGELKVHYQDPNVNPNDPGEIANPEQLWIPSPRKGWVPQEAEAYLPRVWVARYGDVAWPAPGPDLQWDEEPLDPDGMGPCPHHAKTADRRTAWEEYRGYPIGGAGAGEIKRLSPQDKEILIEVDVMASANNPNTPIHSLADIAAKLGRARDVHWTGLARVYWKFDETTAEYRAPESFVRLEDLKTYMRQHRNAALPKYGYVLYNAGYEVEDVADDQVSMEDRAFACTAGISLPHFNSGATAHEAGHLLSMRDAYIERPTGWQDMLMGGNMYNATTLVAWEITQIAITGAYFKQH